MKKDKKKKIEKSEPVNESLGAQAVDRRSVYFVGTLVLLVILTIIYFVIRPEVNKVYSKKNSFEEQRLRLEQIKENAAKVGQYTELTEEIDKDGRFLDNILVNKDDPVRLIKVIEGVAKEELIEIKISQYTPPKKKKTPTLELSEPKPEDEKKQAEDEEDDKNKIWLRLKTKSNYKSFLNFYYRLENMGTIFFIDSVKISKTGNTRGLRGGDETPIDQAEGDIILSVSTQ